VSFIPRWQKILDAFSVLFLVLATLMVFFYAPLEFVMGAVQRVFYFHIAAGWVGMLSFFLAFCSSILFLARGESRWDWLSVCTVELGLVFMTINILTGMVWARPIWNTWWTWDPRLTTASIMVLIYAAYFILRLGIEQPEKQARFAAVYALIGFVSVPLTFISIRVFRTIHPIVLGSGDPTASNALEMTASMRQTLVFGLVAFTILFVSLLTHRYRLQKAEYNLAHERWKVLNEE
jgi:heme exporter protein C